MEGLNDATTEGIATVRRSKGQGDPKEHVADDNLGAVLFHWWIRPVDCGQRMLLGPASTETTDRIAVGRSVGRPWVVVRISVELLWNVPGEHSETL